MISNNTTKVYSTKAKLTAIEKESIKVYMLGAVRGFAMPILPSRFPYGFCSAAATGTGMVLPCRAFITTSLHRVIARRTQLSAPLKTPVICSRRPC